MEGKLNIIKYILIFIILLLKIDKNSIFCCILNGNIEGKCISSNLVQNEISFCKKYLTDYICIPYFQNIWPEWTNNTIDEIIENQIMKNIENEFLFELTDKNIYSLPLINEVGCMKSYINLICKKNFIPCEPDTDMTMPPCKKVCKRFLNNCGTWISLCDDYKEEDCSEK